LSQSASTTTTVDISINVSLTATLSVKTSCRFAEIPPNLPVVAQMEVSPQLPALNLSLRLRLLRLPSALSYSLSPLR